MGKRPDRRGIFQAGIVPVKPLFGKNVHPDENSFRIRVLDMGALDSQNLKGISREDHEAFQAQLFLLVCGGRPWELSDCRRAAGKLFRESQTSQEPWESQKARIKILVNRRESAGNILLPEEARDCAAGFLPWIEVLFPERRRQPRRHFTVSFQEQRPQSGSSKESRKDGNTVSEGF